jgi:hypothetical protein
MQRMDSSLESLQLPCLLWLCYTCQATAITLAGVRRQGECITRSFGWADSMASNSWEYSGQVSGFLSSFSWSCTNIGNGNDCAGNLEQLHNNVHNTIGGDMATLSTAGWDPLFWWVLGMYWACAVRVEFWIRALHPLLHTQTCSLSASS